MRWPLTGGFQRLLVKIDEDTGHPRVWGHGGEGRGVRRLSHCVCVCVCHYRYDSVSSSAALGRAVNLPCVYGRKMITVTRPVMSLFTQNIGGNVQPSSAAHAGPWHPLICLRSSTRPLMTTRTKAEAHAQQPRWETASSHKHRWKDPDVNVIFGTFFNICTFEF